MFDALNDFYKNFGPAVPEGKARKVGAFYQDYVKELEYLKDYDLTIEYYLVE